MNAYRNLVSAVTVGIIIAGCAGSKKEMKPDSNQPAERVVWTSAPSRPGWTVSEPDQEGDSIVFVGVSAKAATEQVAREDAQRNAVNNVSAYLGVLAQDKFRAASGASELSSDVWNPGKVAQSLQEQVSKSFVRGVKAKEWYFEKSENQYKEIFFNAWVLAKVPKSSLDQAFNSTVDSQIAEARRQRDAASEAKMKSQFENAAKVFEQLKAQGFTLE